MTGQNPVLQPRFPLLAAARGAKSLSALVARLAGGESLDLSGVAGSQLAFLVACIAEGIQKPMVLVAKGPREVEELAEDLETIAGSGVYPFPAWETLPEEEVEPHEDILGDRFLLMQRLTGQRGTCARGLYPLFVVTTLRAIAQRMVRPGSFGKEMREISRGMAFQSEELVRYLERGGYRRVDMVEDKGDYCIRGGIVDLFPPGADYPLRIEFLGDEIETLRTFHAQTQRTIEELGAAMLTPFSELSLLRRSGEEMGNLFDYLPPDAVIAVQEPAESLRGLREAAPQSRYLLSTEEIDALFSRRQVVNFSLLPREGGEPVSIRFESLEAYRALALGAELGREWQEGILNSIAEWMGEGMRIAIFCNTKGEAARLEELMAERGLALAEGSGICVGRLSAGFIFREAGLAVITDKELFARYRVRRTRRRFKGTTAVRQFSELRAGDYVVHVGHGIGIYRGITTLLKEGAAREFICIEYQEKSKLYVPLDQASLVERYIGIGATPPRLDRLGGARWAGVRIAAQRAIFDYAAEILQLQAARQLKEGHAFPADTAWQKEFEDAFIYEETPDQLSVIEEVKRDMESPHPMDRLICGDVGYGKTEVAVRAAFKAVTGGKQVAVLVPTTVLAQQHCQTFSDRFADYPVRIEMLSRFRTPGEQAAVLQGLREGRVDIVIGTHRLLQPDVQFKDLGMVVIDEEQRFGVKSKEQLKRLRLTVDVLTMTATPIPRTLYMSLAGIRDMSTINTPPEDRLAIETSVCEYGPGVIGNAIRRELARQGQVFFVHNRVETAARVRDELRALVPGARYAVGHGQMADDELEEVMRLFVEGGIDVLVCTTIIESGLDIPNANTIIIDHADRFGLADLYQLRGRVGRYKRRAYAYLLYHRDAVMLEDARRRLKAVTEHSHLGAGFRIALRDLEIRGAGNILGPEQHGHVAAIGFDLYCKLLKRSIETLKGKKARGVEDIDLNLPYLAELPSSYITSEAQRIDLYKRLGEVTGCADIEDVAAEMRDRFGPLPEAVRLLLDMYRLRLAARDRGIRSVALQDDRIIAVRHGEEIRPGGRYPRVTEGSPEGAVREIRERISDL